VESIWKEVQYCSLDIKFEQLKAVAFHPSRDAVGDAVEDASLSTSPIVTRKLNVLVVDDEQLVADSLVQILKMFCFNAASRYSGCQAIDQAATVPSMSSSPTL
jgi:PleD family two-component response regulator